MCKNTPENSFIFFNNLYASIYFILAIVLTILTKYKTHDSIFLLISLLIGVFYHFLMSFFYKKIINRLVSFDGINKYRYLSTTFSDFFIFLVVLTLNNYDIFNQTTPKLAAFIYFLLEFISAKNDNDKLYKINTFIIIVIYILTVLIIGSPLIKQKDMYVTVLASISLTLPLFKIIIQQLHVRFRDKKQNKIEDDTENDVENKNDLEIELHEQLSQKKRDVYYGILYYLPVFLNNIIVTILVILKCR